MNCVVLNRIAPTASMTKNDVPNCRRPIRRMSTIGSLRNSSHGTKARNAVKDMTAQRVMKFEANQSFSCPLSSTTSRKPSHSATREEADPVDLEPTAPKRLPAP